MSTGGEKEGSLLGSWKPYANSAVPDAVMVRWMLLNPLQVKLIPYLQFTIGEMLVLVASVLYFMSMGAGGGGGGGGEDEDRRRLDEDGEGSGNLAVTAFALCFVTATHNSIFTFLVGLPFERALFW